MSNVQSFTISFIIYFLLSMIVGMFFLASITKGAEAKIKEQEKLLMQVEAAISKAAKQDSAKLNFYYPGADSIAKKIREKIKGNVKAFSMLPNLKKNISMSLELNSSATIEFGTSDGDIANTVLPVYFRVLNLCAGIGGNAYLWKNCDVVAVENDPKIAAVYQKLNPTHKVIVGDAYQYLKDHFNEFDFVWISPPCQKHSKMMKATRHKVADYPDFKLYEVIVFLQHFFKGKWVVENVMPYYEPLIKPTAKIGRHLFWSNFEITAEEVKQPKGFITKSNLQGKKEMMDWLGLHFDEVVYYKKNHCPVQILRNCVHPKLGLAVFENGR